VNGWIVIDHDNPAVGLLDPIAHKQSPARNPNGPLQAVETELSICSCARPDWTCTAVGQICDLVITSPSTRRNYVLWQT
jgi:hypothetical protein